MPHWLDGGPQLRWRNTRKSGRHYADDGVRRAVQQHVVPDGAWVAIEMLFPKVVTQNSDVGTAKTVFIRVEAAAQERLHAINAEILRGDAQGAYVFRPPCPDQVETYSGRRGHVLERPAASLPEIIGVRGKS